MADPQHPKWFTLWPGCLFSIRLLKSSAFRSCGRQTGHYPVLGLVEWSHGAERASNDAVVSKTLSKNRTAGFPQYGFKVDLSSEAFPPLELLKPAPGIHNATDSSLSLFVSFKTETCTPVLSRAGTPFRCRHSSLTALPQRSSLRSGL